MSAVQVVIDLMEVALHAEGVGFWEVHRDGRACGKVLTVDREEGVHIGRIWNEPLELEVLVDLSRAKDSNAGDDGEKDKGHHLPNGLRGLLSELPQTFLDHSTLEDLLWQAAATAALRIIQATLRHLEAAAAIHPAGGCTAGIQGQARQEHGELKGVAKANRHACIGAEPAEGGQHGGGAHQEGQGIGCRGDQDGDATGARSLGDELRHTEAAALLFGLPGVGQKLRGQHKGIIHTQTQQQEVQIVVQVAVGHLEVAHQTQGGHDAHPHDGYGNEGHRHAAVHRVALAQHECTVHDDDAVGGRQLGDISADGVSELIAQRTLEKAGELQQVILLAIQFWLCAGVRVDAHQAQHLAFPFVRHGINDAFLGTVKLLLAQGPKACDVLSTGILPGGVRRQSTHHGLDLGGLELEGALRRVSRVRVQHACGRCGGCHASQGAKLDATAVLACRHVHWSRDFLTVDDLGDGGALGSAVAGGSHTAVVAFCLGGVLLAVDIVAGRVRSGQGQGAHGLLSLPVVYSPEDLVTVQIGDDIVIIPEHVQQVGLGAEGTELGALAAVEDHRSVHTTGRSTEAPVASIDGPRTIVSFGLLVSIIQVGYQLVTIHNDVFHFLIDLVESFDVLGIHDVALALRHIRTGRGEEVEARIAGPGGGDIVIVFQGQ
mmetsp:Transcript_35101/g.75801  ORF Transcript_35101/g.75801 Transcript_35101/m.75801 type:complete len:659 (-) Transcript_35101:217-2193(-)